MTIARALARARACALALALALALAPAPALADPIPAGLPPADRFQLDNGLTVVLVPTTANPYLDVELAFRAGDGLDPAGREGVTDIAVHMLTAGSASVSEDALAAELARLGAFVGAASDMDSLSIAGQIPTLSDKTVRRFLDLFAEVALRPTFPEALLEREKTLYKGRLARIADDPGTLASIAEEAAAFTGQHGRSGYGTAATLQKITRADVADLHAALINPSHGVLVVGGAFDPAAMRTWITAHFGSRGPWPVGQRATDGAIPGRKATLCATREYREVCFDNPQAAPPTQGLLPARTVLVPFEGALTQVPWRLTAANPLTTFDSGWAPFRVGSFVLGGEFTSRLNALLRTQEGLTYGAYFQTGFGGHVSSAMAISTDATPDALIRSITLGKAEMARIAKEPIPTEELEEARQMIIQSFAFKFETLADTTSQYMSLEIDSLPYAWLAGWREALALPSAADIQAVMAGLDPDKMTLVVVGSPTLEKPLRELGHGRFVKVSIGELLERGIPAE